MNLLPAQQSTSFTFEMQAMDQGGRNMPQFQSSLQDIGIALRPLFCSSFDTRAPKLRILLVDGSLHTFPNPTPAKLESLFFPASEPIFIIADSIASDYLDRVSLNCQRVKEKMECRPPFLASLLQ